MSEDKTARKYDRQIDFSDSMKAKTVLDPWSFQLPLVFLVTLALTAFVPGCGRDDVKVYRVAKETPEAPASPHAANVPGQLPAGHPEIGASTPQLKWTLPHGWTERPAGQMRAASFAVVGADGRSADVSVIPLPTTGHEGELVNMWRSQLKLDAVGEDEAAKLSKKVTVGGEEGKLFEIASEKPIIEDKFKGRMLVAILNRGGTSWFFKMTGEESLVGEQKPAFIGFLKSVSFENAPATASAPLMPMPIAGAGTTLGGHSGGKPEWTVPSGWEEAPAGQFLVAKFKVSGPGGAQADVNVSSSVGDGGGLVANVNRWRVQQLGLSATTDAELAKTAKAMDVEGGKATIVELSGTDFRSGQPASMVGVMVSQSGQTWFYKLMGEPRLVESQKEAFMKFVLGAKY